MEEANMNPVAGITTVNAVEAAMGTFQRQQQRRPSNLLQCMDQDGNIDAFRYIEYSRQRRIEFLKRADFICKMKSTLRMQHQQQLHRSASLPRMTALPVVSSVPSMGNELFVDTRDGSVSPEITGSNMFLNTPKAVDAGRRNNTNIGTAGSIAFHLIGRSASMPFVNVGMTNATSAFHSGTTPNSRNAEFETHVPDSRPPQRRRLRKEEFEAAEALLFGMGRGTTDTSLLDGTGSDKRSDNSSSVEDADDVEAEDGVQNRIGDLRPNKTASGSSDSSKKRKISKLPRESILSRSRCEEMGSVLSVVSAEEESSSCINNSNNDIVQEDEDIAAVHGFPSLGNMK